MNSVDEGLAHVVLRLARHVVVGKVLRRDAQRVQPVAPAASWRNRARRACAASSVPARRRASESAAARARRWPLRRVITPAFSGCVDAVVDGLGRNAFVAALLDRVEQAPASRPRLSAARSAACTSSASSCTDLGRLSGQARNRGVGDLQMAEPQRGLCLGDALRGPASRADID